MSKIRIRVLQFSMLAVALLGLTGCSLIGQTIGAIIPLAVRLAPVKLMFLCIPEKTPVDTPDGPKAIELIRPGDQVIGFAGHPVRVLQIHAYAEDPTLKRFLRIQFKNGAKVQLCDMHRIDGTRAQHVKIGDLINEQKVKSIESFDGVIRSYDLLTEDEGYQISGLPVNSMIEEMLEAARKGQQPSRH
ncbi:MAG: Hint domain-containing protein [Verrucomicrobiota bacterium]